MSVATTEHPRSRREELGQFLTATPVADFMASMFGQRRGVPHGNPMVRWGLLVQAIFEGFCPRWTPCAAVLGVCDRRRNLVHLHAQALAALGVTLDSAAKIPDFIHCIRHSLGEGGHLADLYHE
jgi:hypothetical protein